MGRATFPFFLEEMGLKYKDSIIQGILKEILEKEEDLRDKKDNVILTLYRYITTHKIIEKTNTNLLCFFKKPKIEWSLFEEFFLKENAGIKTLDEVCAFFSEAGSERSRDAIVKKIHRLGLWEKYK